MDGSCGRIVKRLSLAGLGAPAAPAICMRGRQLSGDGVCLAQPKCLRARSTSAEKANYLADLSYRGVSKGASFSLLVFPQTFSVLLKT